MIDLHYAVPVEQTGWKTSDGSGTVRFQWDYDAGREELLALYDKGKRKQWDAAERIDWSHEIDLDDPLRTSDEYIPLFGSPMWEKMDERARAEARRHMVAWQFSQFLHGEQGALVCTAKIVQNVPAVDAKFYAATQVMDEARHVEAYGRYLSKLGLAYPVNPHLRSLLDDVLTDARWDMTYLGMQVLIEGLALAAFGLIRNQTGDDLARALNAYVMQDEARHVMFGRHVLRSYYPQLTEAERAEREAFCAEACYLMRDRFLAEEVWETLGLDSAETVKWVQDSELQRAFRSLLFTRIVPTLKDIGLWGPTLRQTFSDMGVMGFESVDLDSVIAEDEQAADDIDAARRAAASAMAVSRAGVDEVVEAGRG
ncbi:MAG: diiron oxygenase [Actinomycetota bacterium]|jgi:hypothetical protein|nr:diiron oxygenase [Actinomycetota bacterium]